LVPFFTKRIQSFGGRRNINAKGNANRAASRFGPVPYSFQYIYINDALKTYGADDTCLYAKIVKRVLLLENSSSVRAEWRPDVSAGISKLIMLILGGSISLVIVYRRNLTSRKKTRYFICK
jgi:hypothetical protein